MPTLSELREERAEVKVAIKRITDSDQEYQTPSGTRHVRADLRTLYSRLKQLDEGIAVASGAWGCQTPVFPGRR